MLKHRQILRRALSATLPDRMLFMRGPRNSHVVSLTFDDGPHPQHTPRVLDLLKEHGVQATFFVIGQRAERFPELIRRMVTEGHIIGHHSYYHADPDLTSVRQLMREVRRTRLLLMAITGRECNLVRPPMGRLNASKLLALWYARQTVVLWNVDPRDYAPQSPDEVGEFFRHHPLHPGDVVLMHDNCDRGFHALSELIVATRYRGLGFVPLSYWLGYAAPTWVDLERVECGVSHSTSQLR